MGEATVIRQAIPHQSSNRRHHHHHGRYNTTDGRSVSIDTPLGFDRGLEPGVERYRVQG